jgi:hypothetical protein
MRSVLFNATSKIAEILIVAGQNIAVFSINVIRFISTAGIQVVSFITKGLLIIIDEERYANLQAYYEQQDMHAELKAINELIILKQDAIAQKKWTDQHTQALHMVGNTLINECDWHEDKMHEYMKGVVESIPGLHYVGGYEDDDDDESIAI